MLAHAGRGAAPHDLWSAWNTDPVLLAGLVFAAWAYWRGAAARRPSQAGTTDSAIDRRRDRCLAAALVTLAVALVSPLDAAAGSLASAHMVQHVLLVLVAAPLLALSAPLTTLLRGSPAAVRDAGVRWRRRLRGGLLGQPVAVWLVHVGTLWFWHAAVPYDAAVQHHLVHVLEHVTFLVTGVLFWAVVTGARSGLGILLVFAMAMQSVFLSLLLTFARSPWYSVYTETTAAWGLEPLADQQLGGVIMWVPAGLVYVGAGLALLVGWIRSSEREELTV